MTEPREGTLSGAFGITPELGTRPVFVIRSSTGTTAVRGVLDHVRIRLTEMRVPQDVLGVTEIVLAETLNNIIEHAYRGCDGSPVMMRVRRLPDRLQIRITDRGAPMPGGAPPASQMPSVDGDIGALPESGFGWPLINMLTGKVGYSRRANGNVIDLDLPIVSTPSSFGPCGQLT